MTCGAADNEDVLLLCDRCDVRHVCTLILFASSFLARLCRAPVIFTASILLCGWFPRAIGTASGAPASVSDSNHYDTDNIVVADNVDYAHVLTDEQWVT